MNNLMAWELLERTRKKLVEDFDLERFLDDIINEISIPVKADRYHLISRSKTISSGNTRNNFIFRNMAEDEEITLIADSASRQIRIGNVGKWKNH